MVQSGDEWDERDPACKFRDARPVAMGSKARAEEIVGCIVWQTMEQRTGADIAVMALDRAHFFADPAVLAEIAELVRKVSQNETISARSIEWRNIALAIATAVRKLGIGGGR